MYGQYANAKAQSESLLAQAAVNEIKAVEILERMEINNETVRIRSGQAMAEAQARTGGAGIDSQSVLASMEEVARLASEEIVFNSREARFEASMTRLEGQSMKDSASQVRKAGTLAMLNTGVQAVIDYNKNKPGTMSPTPNTSGTSSTGAGRQSILGGTKNSRSLLSVGVD